MDKYTQTQNEYVSNMQGRYKITVGCIGALLLLLIVTMLGREIFFRYDIANTKKRPSHVAISFTESLQQNEYRTAKALVISDLFLEITSWMEAHQPVNCPFRPLLFLEDEYQGSGYEDITADLGPDKHRYNEFIHMPCPDYENYYCLEVRDIDIRQEEDEWLVVNIGEIIETWEVNYCEFNTR